MKTAGLQGGLLGAARGTDALGPAGGCVTTAAFAPSSGFPAALKPPPEDGAISSFCSSISSSELLGSSSGSDSELCLLLFAPLMLRMFSGTAAPGSCIALGQNVNTRIGFSQCSPGPQAGQVLHTNHRSRITQSPCLSLTPGFTQTGKPSPLWVTSSRIVLHPERSQFSKDLHAWRFSQLRSVKPQLTWLLDLYLSTLYAGIYSFLQKASL